ncbi:MAG TPA: 2-C-methyl-D-erythritol 2,4-cyclodiphosphate synthase [Victivallales bacterium]|nr:2-C-methyl-D-erythritol 2,4-cyclodiphosphate synthase [Victivallales bacterium]HPO90929.1 2-C-methyl-D-erythritol 2,4-cyclodiphosphate synthase [Victivallales bacterium]HRU01965.1 2-C-methyl-D-erythritol 2,4-cyclodiphosphate synthase [Victivallales bacterium]
MLRIGNGFDVHPFSENRDLILGGVKIPFGKGLNGHSDADVLIHAIMDALLGALAAGDIGIHFPNNDPKYSNANSLKLLEMLHGLAIFANWRICNIDTIILAERPKLFPYFSEMRKNISSVLKISENCISVKATTTEKLGFVGREEGIAAMAVVLLENIK